MPETTPAPPAIPDYTLLRLVGRGGYGDVWLARSVTGVFRAVKIVWRARFPEAHPYEREFSGLREFARISLTESRQLALLHVGRHDEAGFFYYVMELADDAERGRNIDPRRYTPLTLKKFLHQGHRLPVATVIAHAIELARALATLHARGLVHRDIKPSNIILIDGQPRLADIGLVAAADAALSFVGTEGYVPPEGPGTPAADVFSFGKLLFELSTGHDRLSFPRLPEDLATLPDRRELMELNEVVLRACEPSLALRYPHAGAMLEELLLLQAGRSLRRLRLTERGLARARRATVALVLLATVAGGAVFLERQRVERATAGLRAAEAERDLLLRQNLYSARLARAQRALELGDLGRARLALAAPDPGESDLRGFEWHALTADADGDPAVIVRDLGPSVRRVIFSPDGHRLAVADAGPAVTVYDARTHQPLRRIDGVHRLTGFSADGRWLLGADDAFHLTRWDAATGQRDAASLLPGINRPLQTGPAGARLATFTDAPAPEETSPGLLRIWNFDTATEELRLDVAPRQPSPLGRWQFHRAAVSPNLSHALVVLIASGGTATEWSWQLIDLATRARVAEARSPTPLAAVACTADARTIALFDSATGILLLGDPQTGLWREIAVGGRGATAQLAFSPDGRLLALGGTFASVRVFDVATGEAVAFLRGHAGGVNDATWSPRNDSLLTGGTAGDVRRWSPAALYPALACATDPRLPSLSDLIVADDGRTIGLRHANDRLRLFDAATLTLLGEQPGVRWPLRLTPAGELWWIDPAARLRRGVLAAGAATVAPQALTSEPHLILGCQLTPAGDEILVNRRDGWSLHDATTGARRLNTRQAGHASAEAAFLADGSSLVTFTHDLQLLRWDRQTGWLLAQATTAAAAVHAAYSPDGRWLAVSTESGEVEIHDGESLALRHRLAVTSPTVAPAAFSPDGPRLVIGGTAGTIQVFATEDWREITSLVVDLFARPEQRQLVTALEFSRDGRSLVATTENGRTKVWRW